jgi:hypothetical protein
VLSDLLIELALLEQLGRGAQGHAQGSHGRTQAKGFLHGAGSSHFVLAETDPESARLAATLVATTLLATTLIATAAPAPARSPGLPVLGTGIEGLVSHCHGLGCWRKCAASHPWVLN